MTYTEIGLHVEQVAAPLDMAIAQRVMLAISTGQTLCVEPARASFLLPANMSGLQQLTVLLERERERKIAITPVDSEDVEVCLQGTWIAPNPAADEGVFMTVLRPEIEAALGRLWQASQFQLAAST